MSAHSRFDASLARDGAARRGAARRPRTATIETPAFMPVGTAGTVKAMTARGGRGDRRATSCSATPIT